MIDTARFSKAVELWQSGAVAHNGAAGQYYVASQTGNGVRYLAASSWAACGLKCNCEDARRGHICKHQMAATLAEAAARIDSRLQQGQTIQSIAQELIHKAIDGSITDDRRDVAWSALWEVCQQRIAA